MEEKNFLQKRFAECEMPLTDEQVAAFLSYAHQLVEKNKVMNLTAITEFSDIVEKHFIDSAILFSSLVKNKKIKNAKNIIDVGTGAGFPGLPLKIYRPEISLCLLDALQKRIGFLQEVCAGLAIEDVQFCHARSEDGGRSNLRETFDIAVSRAVANISVLAEYDLPFVKVGGVFVAYKSGDVEEELKTAEKAISVLGGKVDEVISYQIPGTEYQRSLVVIEKIRPTSKAYPRKAGKIEKNPIQ